MIAVVDYGMGNVGSILNMCRHLGIPCRTVATVVELRSADKLVLPGVGSFDAGMERLRTLGLVEALGEAVLGRRTPILGICLGMQLFTRTSEEGNQSGLGWLAADTRRLPVQADDGTRCRLPHMGWAEVAARADSQLFAGAGADERYYFVHSYRVVCDDHALAAATAEHGVRFTAAIEAPPIFGTQFHPEKSHRFGMRILRNFAAL